MERAIDLDPRNSFTLQQVALNYRHLRRFADEKSVLDRALTVEPNDVVIRLERATVEFNWKADTRPLHQVLDSFLATNPAPLEPLPTIGTIGFIAHWPNAMLLPQKMP